MAGLSSILALIIKLGKVMDFAYQSRTQHKLTVGSLWIRGVLVGEIAVSFLRGGVQILLWLRNPVSLQTL